ncbi:hypothetical protein [Moellerella wisconsensis]|uniref:hypothetical protein n=1 Tax=Moellerella wisconsensis TaxID=158849 RepID=UPI001F4D9245|nr:hypothetical protein [Moellerella wisconsensis]UNH23529.1 hypothetical protein MNY68_11985 [Moellerella wisconsensis]
MGFGYRSVRDVAFGYRSVRDGLVKEFGIELDSLEKGSGEKESGFLSHLMRRG